MAFLFPFPLSCTELFWILQLVVYMGNTSYVNAREGNAFCMCKLLFSVPQKHETNPFQTNKVALNDKWFDAGIIK